MIWKIVKLVILISLCFTLVTSQQQTPTTTDMPVNQTIDSATIMRYNLNVGAANVDYGAFAYHRKYIPTSSGHHFSYDEAHPRGPSRWAQEWPMCGGPLQSPIDIPVEQCIPDPTPEHRLQYFNSEAQPSNVTIENNGYSIEYIFHFDQTPVLFGGPLNTSYVFEFIHFHWGLTDGNGSEHRFNGQSHELEMHLGHRNSKYRDMGEAAMNEDGIVVLAFMFQASDAAPDILQLEELPNVQAVNTSVNPLNPADYVLANFVGDLNEQVVNVRGSLTTPPCSPANWLLATQIREMSRNDMDLFRQARRNGDPIAPNFRPIQNRENRQCRSYGGLF